MYPDAQLVGRFTVVVVSQILHELSQVYFGLALLPPKNAKLLKNGNRVDVIFNKIQSRAALYVLSSAIKIINNINSWPIVIR